MGLVILKFSDIKPKSVEIFRNYLQIGSTRFSTTTVFFYQFLNVQKMQNFQLVPSFDHQAYQLIFYTSDNLPLFSLQQILNEFLKIILFRLRISERSNDMFHCIDIKFQDKRSLDIITQ